MLESKEAWHRVEKLLSRIMMCREEEERRALHGGGAGE